MPRCAACPVSPSVPCFFEVQGLAGGCAAVGRGVAFYVAMAVARSDDVPLAARLARVAACPDRGDVLPHPLQSSCGCGEWTACHAGRGAVPGRVTLRECLSCVAQPEAVPRA